MPSQLAAVLRYLRHAARAIDGDDTSDARLLQQFVAERSEAAFTALLERYGPLVLAVCRRILRDAAGAEDAFQATFLVLARKAGSIRKQGSLAAWLHRVALNVSRTTRTATARRQAHERQAALMSQATREDKGEPHDWQPLLHEEVDRLPEKYRVPIVLCYFQGLTHDAAARQLDWPVGTVKGRLARARDLLRPRLARRGLALTSGGLAAALAGSAARAAVPPALLARTLPAAVSFAAGGPAAGGTASAHAVTLAKGALQTMTAKTLTPAVVLLLAAGLVGVGAALGTGAGRQVRPHTPNAEDRAPAPKKGGAALEPGPEVNGLRAKATPAKKRFEVGEAGPEREEARKRLQEVVKQRAAGPQLKLRVIGPARAPVSAAEVKLDVVLSTDGNQSYEFQLGAFPQDFGVYLVGPRGVIQPDKILPQNWMHQEHGPAVQIRVAKGRPYRTTVKLADYFPVGDAEQFRAGTYRVNVKFYDVGLKMPAPIDSGPVRFELAPGRREGTRERREEARNSSPNLPPAPATRE